MTFASKIKSIINQLKPSKKMEKPKLTFNENRLRKYLETKNIDMLCHASYGTKFGLADLFIVDNKIEEIATEDKEELGKQLLAIRNEMTGAKSIDA